MVITAQLQTRYKNEKREKESKKEKECKMMVGVQ